MSAGATNAEPTSGRPARAPDPPRRATGHRALLLWTLFVLIAVGVLLKPDLVDSPGGNPWPGTSPTPEGESVSWLTNAGHWLRLVHLSVFPAYPWILLAPYVFWLTARSQGPGRLADRVGRAAIWIGAGLVWMAATTTFHRLADRVRPDLIVLAFLEDRIEITPSPEAGRAAARTNRAQATTWMTVQAATGDAPPRLLSAWFSNLHNQAEARENSGAATTIRVDAADEERVLVRETESSRKLRLGEKSASGLPPMTHPFPRFRREWEPQREAIRLPLGRPGGAMTSVLLDFFAFGSLAGLAHAWHYHRQSRDRERQALALESSLARARLHALQAQLQPHFLFNTLNSVTAMLRQNPRTAEEMLVSLADLLRLVLGQSSRQQCTLREDLRFVELYVEIQQFRFGSQLAFETDVEPAVWNCQVPTLLLQPLVENAIRHGLEPAGRPVIIRVTGRATIHHRLELVVEDDGIGSPPVAGETRSTGAGLGLANVRARLAACFGDAATLELCAPPIGSGFRVRLNLPARTIGEPADPAANDQRPS